MVSTAGDFPTMYPLDKQFIGYFFRWEPKCIGIYRATTPHGAVQKAIDELQTYCYSNKPSIQQPGYEHLDFNNLLKTIGKVRVRQVSNPSTVDVTQFQREHTTKTGDF